MIPFFYRGTLSPRLRSHVLRRSEQFTQTMRASVEAFQGTLIRCHLTAVRGDPIGVVEFPSDAHARAWSTFYGSQKGVRSSEIQRLLRDEDLQSMQELIDRHADAATGHRRAE